MSDVNLMADEKGEGFAFNAWYICKFGPHAVIGWSFTPVGALIEWQEGRR